MACFSVSVSFDCYEFCNYFSSCGFAASMPLTKHLNVAIIDSNPALLNGITIKKDDLPDPRVSTVTPATISIFKGISLALVSHAPTEEFK